MTFSSAASRFALSSLLAAAGLAVIAQTCLADIGPAAPGDPTGDTDHIVGDTFARGIELVLKPAHSILSRACFRVSRSFEPRHITAIELGESATRKQAQPQQQ